MGPHQWAQVADISCRSFIHQRHHSITEGLQAVLVPVWPSISPWSAVQTHVAQYDTSTAQYDPVHCRAVLICPHAICYSPCMYGEAQSCMAQQVPIWYRTDQYNLGQPCAAQYDSIRSGSALHGAVQPSTAQHGAVQCSAWSSSWHCRDQYGPVWCNTNSYGPVKHKHSSIQPMC